MVPTAPMRWCGQKDPPAGYGNITVRAENGCVRIGSAGKSRACGRAAGSVNAIGLVVGYLLDNGLCTPQE